MAQAVSRRPLTVDTQVRFQVRVRFVADKFTVKQVYLLVFRGFLFSNIPPMLHTLLHLHVALTRRKNARSLGTF